MDPIRLDLQRFTQWNFRNGCYAVIMGISHAKLGVGLGIISQPLLWNIPIVDPGSFHG